MIKMLNQRLNTLLKEEIKKHMEDEESSMPNYDKIRDACDIAFHDKQEWNDLSYIHQMKLDLQIEQMKEPDEKQRKDIGEIVERYKMREQNIIDMMVEYDNKMIKSGLVKFNEETGDVEMSETIIMNYDESKEISINEEKGGNKKQRLENENDRKTIEMRNAMNDDDSMDSTSTKSLAESIKRIHTMDDSMITNEENQKQQIKGKEIKKSSLQKAKERMKNHKDFTTATSMMKQSYSDITKHSDKNDMIKANNDEITKIRVRYQFKTDNIPVGKQFREQI